MPHIGQLFTKSTEWYDDTMGWKSSMGGFSAIQPITTDQNNMGGFFVRKCAGAAAMAFYLQKIGPVLVHPQGAVWVNGHFISLFTTAIVGNIAIILFYLQYLHDLQAAKAGELALAIVALLLLETIVLLWHVLTFRKHPRPAVAIRMPEGKTPSSISSRIVGRTVGICSTALAVVAFRDLCFPGTILDVVPRDDIYLEWTNAFFHSPPQGSPEYEQQGLEAPLYIGDKFVSQLMALYILLNCMFKVVGTFGVRYGNDGSGLERARMFWKGQAVGDVLLLLVVRFFTLAAASASLDLKWALMPLAYEALILGLYGWM